MSRFVSPDLAKLPKPDLLEPVSFQTGLSARLADLKARAASAGVSYDTGHLATDPLRRDQEVSMDRELMLRARVNDAGKAVMLATSWGSNLDHIAATYYGISRLATRLISDEPTGQPVTFESDDDFRARIALAPEAFSTAGPEGAYVFHALELNGRHDVSDAAAYSEEDGAHYPGGAAVLAPEILVIVVPSPERIVREPWSANMTLRAEVLSALSARDVRPLGDKVTVAIAERVAYSVTAELRFKPGADKQLALAAARERVRAYAAEQRRVGAVVERLGLGAALKVAGVASIELSQPAADVDGGSLGCPEIDTITVTAVDAQDGWR